VRRRNLKPTGTPEESKLTVDADLWMERLEALIDAGRSRRTTAIEREGRALVTHIARLIGERDELQLRVSRLESRPVNMAVQGPPPLVIVGLMLKESHIYRASDGYDVAVNMDPDVAGKPRPSVTIRDRSIAACIKPAQRYRIEIREES
jgi:hypothetical protein